MSPKIPPTTSPAYPIVIGAEVIGRPFKSDEKIIGIVVDIDTEKVLVEESDGERRWCDIWSTAITRAQYLKYELNGLPPEE